MHHRRHSNLCRIDRHYDEFSQRTHNQSPRVREARAQTLGMDTKDRELLFIGEVARMHGRSVDTVRDDIRRGLLKAILTASGTRLIRR